MKDAKKFFIAIIFCLALFRTACAEIQVDLSKIPVPVSKLNFLTLYKTQWSLFGMERKLRAAIDEAFHEQTADLLWGTKGLQLATNRNNIIEKIQQSLEFKFAASYDKFLQELEMTWGEKLREDILTFYKRSNEALYFELQDNPMAQAYLRQDYDIVTEDKGLSVMNRISTNLAGKYKLTGATLIGGGLLLLARKHLANHVTKTLLHKVAGSAAGKLASGAVPVIGWAMLAWSAWDLYTMAAETEDDLKKKFYELNSAMYCEEVPLVYWEGMEGYVRDAYIIAYEKILSGVNKGIAGYDNQKIKELKAGLSKSEERFFFDRLALVQEVLEGYDLDKILDAFGTTIRDSNLKDFDKLVLTLRDLPPEKLEEYIAARHTSEDINKREE